MRMLLNGGIGPSGRVVSQRAFDAFMGSHVPAPDWGEGVHYGYGIAIEIRDGERVLRHTGGMVSFMSSLQVNLDAGVGAFASINAQQGYRPNRVTRYALDSMRASRLKAPPPPEPIADERDAPAIDDYLGAYTNAAGRRLEVVADGGRLVLIDGARRIPLESYGGDQFVAPDAAFAPHVLVFERSPLPTAASGNDKSPVTAGTAEAKPPPAIEILGHGEQSYFHSRFAGSREGATPSEMRSLQGTYRCDDPWIGTMRIVARRSRLWMQSSWEGPVPLLAAGPNTYRIGDPQAPDVVRFEGFADGQPQVLSIWGVSVMRASV